MRPKLTSLVLAGVQLFSFGCVSAAAHGRLDALETRAGDDDARIASLEERVAVFEATVNEVLVLYRRASSDFDRARREYERARRAASASSGTFREAEQNYKTAARNWRLVTITLLAAAQWDYAGHLCATKMTTSQYRRALRDEGIELDGLDADHGLPKSMGGADHPLNYRMIDSSLNRSLGNDVVRKLMVHPTHVLQGATVSAMMRLRCSPRG